MACFTQRGGGGGGQGQDISPSVFFIIFYGLVNACMTYTYLPLPPRPCVTVISTVCNVAGGAFPNYQIVEYSGRV